MENLLQYNNVFVEFQFSIAFAYAACSNVITKTRANIVSQQIIKACLCQVVLH